MLGLALRRDTGEVFVGATGYLEVTDSPGILLPVKVFTELPDTLEGPNYENFAGALIFQEISFEPGSGIRRGYLLQGDNVQGQHLRLSRRIDSIKAQADLFYYLGLRAACRTPTLPSEVLFTFGKKEEFSVGELVHMEVLVEGRELLTVRMRRQFGLMPDLLTSRIPERCRSVVQRALEKVIEGFRTSPPESVIDRCREAMTAILSGHLDKAGKDLGNLITDYDRHLSHGRDTTSDLAHVVARLHSRGKHAEQTSKDLPPISEREAELSVAAVGVVLVNLGWAVWR